MILQGFKAHVSREPTNIVVKIPEPHQPQEQAGIQYNGAPAARPSQQVRQQAPIPTTPRRQQTQQYIQVC